MASSCGHLNKPHYSNGMCQSCYLAQYYLKRKAKNMAKKAALEMEQQENAKASQDDASESSGPKNEQSKQ